MEWDAKPRIRTFITLREEAFGGYLYNPYLLRATPLNHVEFRLTTLCTGHRTLRDVYRQVLPDLPATAGPREDRFLAIIGKLCGVHAIAWTRQCREAGSAGVAVSTEAEAKPELPDGCLSAPLSVIWDVTYRCNLSCSHCLSSSGSRLDDELSLDEALGVVAQLAASKVFTITFAGGEPLLRRGIFQILERATRSGMGLKISTNGVLLTDAVLRKIEDWNVFAVQVSLDGTAATHDELRGRKGTHASAVQAITRLTEAGYYTVVAPVVTRKNIDEIDAVLDTALEVGASAFKPSLFLPAGRGMTNRDHLWVTPERLRALAAHLEARKRDLGDQIEMEIEGFYSGGNGSDLIVNRGSCDPGIAVGCSAATTQVVITASGKVVPCPFLYDLVAGDLRTESFQSIWRNGPSLNIFRNLTAADLKGRCRRCSHIPQSCRGGCRAAAYLLSGDLCGEDPLCWR